MSGAVILPCSFQVEAIVLFDSATDSSTEGNCSRVILDLVRVDARRIPMMRAFLRVCARTSALCVHAICESSTLCVQTVCLAVTNIYSPPRLDVIREQRWQIVLMSPRILCRLLMSGVECKWGFQDEAACPLWEILHEGSLFEMRTVDVIAVQLSSINLTWALFALPDRTLFPNMKVYILFQSAPVSW